MSSAGLYRVASSTLQTGKLLVQLEELIEGAKNFRNGEGEAEHYGMSSHVFPTASVL